MPRRLWEIRFTAIIEWMLRVPHGNTTAQHVQGPLFAQNPTWSADQLSQMAANDLEQLSLMVNYAITESASADLSVNKTVQLITASIRLVEIYQTKGQAAVQMVIDQAKSGTWPIYFGTMHDGNKDLDDLLSEMPAVDSTEAASSPATIVPDCSTDAAMQYLRDQFTMANASCPGQLRAQWRLHAIMSDSVIKPIISCSLEEFLQMDLCKYERPLRNVCDRSPQWRAVIAYAISERSRKQIRANKMSRYSHAVLDCCQLWEQEVTQDAIQESLRDPHLIRSELLAAADDHWEPLPMPEYRMSNKTVVPMRWMLRTVRRGSNPVAYVCATDIEHGLAIKQLVDMTQRNKPIMKDLKLHTWQDEYYLTAIDAVVAVSRKNKRSSPKFTKWVMEHAAQYYQPSDVSGLQAISCKEPKISCIYLIRIGSVAELRDHLGIPIEHADACSVYKYGKTRNYKARKQQHDNLWSTVCGVWPQTVAIQETDAGQLTTKEKEVRDHFAANKRCLVHTTYQELVILSERQLVEAETWLDRL